MGIGYICLALLLFAFLDTTAKWLGRSLPAFQITYLRYLGALAIAAFLFNPLTTRDAWTTRRPLLQAVRGLILFGSTLFNFIAVRHLQLSETMAIAFAAPLLVAALSGPMLGEWIGPKRWAAILVGFSGVLVVTRPGMAAFDPNALWCLAAAVCYAFYAITTRRLTGIDSPASMLIISALVPVVLMTPVMPFVWVAPPTAFHWLLIATLGVYGAVGHFFLIRAYANAPAPIAAPFTYTQLVWMIALGWLVFGDVPGANVMIGAGIVAASGIYLILSDRARAKP